MVPLLVHIHVFPIGLQTVHKLYQSSSGADFKSKLRWTGVRLFLLLLGF